MAAPNEIAIDGVFYSVSRLDAFKQLHISRRLLKVLGGLPPGALQAGKDADSLFDNLGPIATALNELSDEDTEFVIKTCLSAVNRKLPKGAGWGPVMASNGRLMYEDIDLPLMLRLTFEVVRDNLAPFFSKLPATGEPAPAPEA